MEPPIEPVFDAVLPVIDLDHMVDIAAVLKPCKTCAVTVLIQRKHDDAAPRKLNRVCRAGFAVVLVPVQQQNARRILGARRCIELIGQIADLGWDCALRNLNCAVCRLKPICKEYADEYRRQQGAKQRGPFDACLFHTSPPV